MRHRSRRRPNYGISSLAWYHWPDALPLRGTVQSILRETGSRVNSTRWEIGMKFSKVWNSVSCIWLRWAGNCHNKAAAHRASPVSFHAFACGMLRTPQQVITSDWSDGRSSVTKNSLTHAATGLRRAVKSDHVVNVACRIQCRLRRLPWQFVRFLCVRLRSLLPRLLSVSRRPKTKFTTAANRRNRFGRQA